MSPDRFETIDAPPTTLGEGPMWSVRDKALYWIDIVGKSIFRLTPSTGRVDTRVLPYAPSALVPRAAGGLLMITKKGAAVLDFDGEVRSIQVPMVDFSVEVFNDAGCDRAGRLWVGTRDLHAREPKGSLFRLDPDFAMTRHAEGYTVSNGIAWSPDGRTMYHVESRPGRVDAWDFDPAGGTIANRRTFITYPDGIGDHGRPDGCTVDAEGFLWVAEVDGWRLARYAPDGRLDREVRLPFRKPTSVMFGGEDLGTLYVTSMRFGLKDDELAAQPLAGALLAMDVGVKGVPEPEFGNPSP